MKRKRLSYWQYPHLWNDFRYNRANPIISDYGVYLIEHIPTGCCYVGASKNIPQRILDHASSRTARENNLLSDCIQEFGRGEFGITILYVSIDKTNGLHEAEALLIEAYNCLNTGLLVDSGFNTRAAETPEEYKKQLSISLKESWADPVRRAKRLAIGASAETRKKKSVANKGRIRVTNGTKEMFLLPHENVPDGWYRGGVSRKSDKPRPEHHLQSTRTNNVGRFYINNGLVSKMIYPDQPIPLGWTTGMKPRSQH